MPDDFTLIILVHDRQRYLTRILDYYQDSSFSILIADSTIKALNFTNDRSNISYYHFPKTTLTEKISEALQYVKTIFVALCGVDDFTIPEGLHACLTFLKENQNYSSAVGNCFYYNKDSVSTKNIEYFTIYDQVSRKISEEDTFERLEHLFNPFVTLVTAIHYTKHLLVIFNKAKNSIKNLFLNEYLTCIYPVIKGNNIELPVLFQLREHQKNSDGQTTVNLNQLILHNKNKSEYNEFIDIHALLLQEHTGKDFQFCRKKLDNILTRYAGKLEDMYNQKLSFTKRVGRVVSLIPVIGRSFVLKRRKKVMQKKINRIIKSGQDINEIKKIEKCIYKHEDAVG